MLSTFSESEVLDGIWENEAEMKAGASIRLLADEKWDSSLNEKIFTFLPDHYKDEGPRLYYTDNRYRDLRGRGHDFFSKAG